MATYKQIQDFLKKEYGRSFKSCWIADVKNQHGLTSRQAPNRQDANSRVHPCPKEHIDKVEGALRYFEMI